MSERRTRSTAASKSGAAPLPILSSSTEILGHDDVKYDYVDVPEWNRRIRLRSLLVAVAFIAMALALVVQHRRGAARERELTLLLRQERDRSLMERRRFEELLRRAVIRVVDDPPLGPAVSLHATRRTSPATSTIPDARMTSSLQVQVRAARAPRAVAWEGAANF